MVLCFLSLAFTLYAIARSIDEHKDAHLIWQTYVAGILLVLSFVYDDNEVQAGWEFLKALI